MFNPDEIAAEVAQQLLSHWQWHTGALLFFAVPDVRDKAQAIPQGQSPLREYIETLCRVVNAQPPRDEQLAYEVLDITQTLAEGLCSLPWANGYEIPAAFWKTRVGALILAAQLWAQGDELITLSEAARILRGAANQTTLGYMNGLIRTGKLAAYVDSAEPNPQRARRVRRSDVEAMRDA